MRATACLTPALAALCLGTAFASTATAQIASADTLRAGGVARTAAAWAFLPTVTLGATWARSELGQTRDAITSAPRNEQGYYRLTLSWSPLDQPGRWMAQRRPAVARQVELSLTRLSRARLLRERSELNVELAARRGCGVR